MSEKKKWKVESGKWKAMCDEWENELKSFSIKFLSSEFYSSHIAFHFPLSTSYSYLRAIIGSTFAARRAGR
jgi:hypothetical protein